MVQALMGKSPAWLALLALLLLPGAFVAAQNAPALDATTALTKILNGDPAAWKFNAKTYEVQALENRPALIGQRALTVESTAVYAAPMEYTFTFTLRPQGTTRTSFGCSVAVAERPDKTKQSLAFTVTATGGSPAISYSRMLTGMGSGIAKGPGADRKAGSLSLSAVGDRSLAWPEELRKTIEAQIAATPRLEDIPFTVRILLNAGRARIWLNDRLVDETPLQHGAAPNGVMQVQLAPGSALFGVKAQAPQVVDARFEPVSIGGHLNAAGAPTGGKIVAMGLPNPALKLPFGEVLTLHGTPFLFPEIAYNGNDHIDVGASWTRFGALQARISARGGLFGGRWTSADRVDPARIAMYIPYGQYQALHLIAAADGEANSVPIVSAQFFRPAAGHPVNFTATVPQFTDAKAKVEGIEVKLEKGPAGRLYHITIPLDPDQMSWFSDLDMVGLELTKEVRPFRAYPDPMEYSWHASGLPSGVHVYALTLERTGIDTDIQPDATSHVWTAPAQPGYTVTLRNRTGKASPVRLTLATVSKDGKDTTTRTQNVNLPATDAPVAVKFPNLGLTRYGLHQVKLTVTAGTETAGYQRSLAYLHPDTRERGNWAEGKGAIFGFWAWGGSHGTPGWEQEMRIMAAAGAETSTRSYSKARLEEGMTALAAELQIQSAIAFDPGSHYTTLFSGGDLPQKYNPADPEGSGQAMVERLKTMYIPPSPITKSEYLAFFAEPQIGPITAAVPPTYYNEPDYQMTPSDLENYNKKIQTFLIGAKAVRKEWPNVKLLFPYGDPMNTVVFLQKSEEARKYIDGVAIDVPGFERLPESQIHQVVLNRLYVTLKEIRKYIHDPYLTVVEGPTVSSKDVDMSEDAQADITVRNFLTLIKFGIYHHESANAAFDCSGYWGENHYGGGLMSRLPHAMPKQAYVAYATMTRHLNRANCVQAIPTGSTSVYCQQYKHYRTGKLVHVLWTIRGVRPVTVKVPAGATLQVYDENDNATELKEKDGVVTFTIDASPCYLEGLTGDAQITLGTPDHSDAAPAQLAKKLTNLGDGSWKLVAKADDAYANNHPLQVARFLGKMSVKAEAAPAAQGGKALAVHLDKQEIERDIMPYYTTLEPSKPITIPGKGSHLGLWVRASSDWGRVVYSLRDAKGERWLSVGKSQQWNCDDIHNWSFFNFDGWRYLRFQLPNSSPYDSYRELGTTWWGSHGGDTVVDYPLTVEKIIVERRTKVIYQGELAPTKTDDVLLGDLYVEYERAQDQTEEAVKLSRVRMPMPKGEPVIANPIAEMTQTGVGAPTQVLRVTDPEHYYDGTRCHVHFTPVEGAKSYDIWVSPYADGRGALQLGKGWTSSGGLIQNLRPDTTFYAYVVYTDKDGKLSKPSKPLTFSLQDLFGNK